MAKKTVAILQSNYIPWKGYFDLIRRVDEFVLYDDMQYTRRDWRNRNLIKTPRGPEWLTIPVNTKGKYLQAIKDTLVETPNWTQSHWSAIEQNYAKAPYFKEYKARFRELYERANKLTRLSDINHLFLTSICDLLGTNARISWSMDYNLVEGKTERLVGLCISAGASQYISGPAAKDYIVPELFQAAGIELTYMDYSGYPEYPQQFGAFTHGVSILDLIFNTGPKAQDFMKSFATTERGTA